MIYIISQTKLRRVTHFKFTGMFLTLLVYFANYGLMYLIAPWDYSDAYRFRTDGTKTEEAESISSGFYVDFGVEWYLDVGA